MLDYSSQIYELCEIAKSLDNERLLNTGKFLKQRILNPESYVVCLGETSSGKSTIINSLIGEDVLPVSASATTGVVAEIRFERDCIEKEFYAINKNATMETVSQDTFVALARKPDEELERLRLCVHSDNDLSGVRVFDTPGYDSLVEQHEEILMDFLPNCDSIIFVVSYKVGIQDADYNFLETLSFMMKEREGMPFCLVINRCPNGTEENDNRIQEIKQYVLGLLEQKEVPTIIVCSFDRQKETMERCSVELIKNFIVDSFRSEESEQLLQMTLKNHMLDFCLMLENDLDKKIAVSRLDSESMAEAQALYQEYIDGISSAIENVVEPRFDDLIRRFPIQVDYCSEDMERHCVEEIKNQKRLEKEETNIYIKHYLLKRNGEKQAKELQLFIKTEIESIDRDVFDYINESVIKIENDLKIKNVNEATRTAVGILTDVTGKGIERGLIGYCAKFGGQGGSGAGMANLASHALKKFGDFFGKTFSRSTHNALKHTMSKVGLTSTKAISCSVAVIIDTLQYAVDLATWKARLISAIKKVVKDWNKDVKVVTISDLRKLKEENVKSLKDFMNIAEQEFPAYTDDNSDDLKKYTDLKDRLETIKRSIPV